MSKGTYHSSGPPKARWRGRSCSAAPREGTGCRNLGTVCGAWAGWFCGSSVGILLFLFKILGAFIIVILFLRNPFHRYHPYNYTF